MNHELLNDEQLSIVVGGAHCDGTGGGKGNGGGDPCESCRTERCDHLDLLWVEAPS